VKRLEVGSWRLVSGRLADTRLERAKKVTSLSETNLQHPASGLRSHHLAT
jgi:hypothetical protein